jgi:uncharacterized membrane protein YedE/YeeE
MTGFTPYSALAGGALIGTAAVLLLWLNGRIAGVSNIAGNLLFASRGDILWRILFLAGLIAGAGVYFLVTGSTPAGRPDFPRWLLGIAGLLVGFGTSLGGGCTSGHGVCGVARLSSRSLVATLVFLLTGMATAVYVRHVAGVF